VFLYDDAVMKVSSNIEDQFPKDDEILVSKSRLSSIVLQSPSRPAEGILLLHFSFNKFSCAQICIINISYTSRGTFSNRCRFKLFLGCHKGARESSFQKSFG